MELKLERAARFAEYKRGSNRTFMELKRSQRRSIISILSVLIVPLWN